jgi:hypothetical protein
LFNLKNFSIHLKSMTPLLMGNDTLANPLHPLKKQMSAITSIKKKQDEHHLSIAKLGWQASLYYDEEIGVYISSKMLLGCFKSSAREEKKGMMMKAVIIDCPIGAPLIPYEKMTPEKLWNMKNKKGEQVHVHTEAVNVQKAKTMRTRAIFSTWEVKFNIYLNVEILSIAELKRIIERAGFEYGMGECRPQKVTGVFGRFNLEEMKEI